MAVTSSGRSRRARLRQSGPPLRRTAGRALRPVALVVTALVLLSCALSGGIANAADPLPADVTVRTGETATFDAGAPAGAMFYTWYRVATPTDRSVHSNMSDGTYSFTVTDADDGARFYVSYLFGGRMTRSRTATLSVGDGTAAIVTQPRDAAVLDSRPVSFEVAARGAAPLAFQWQRSDDAGDTWTDVPAATSPRLRFAADAAADDGALFRAVVDNAVGEPAVSDAAALAVRPLTGTLQPVEHASLEWGISRIYQGGNPAGNGCNFFSAGKTLGFADRLGDVRIVHRTQDGLISTSPGTKCSSVAGDGLGQRVLFTEGSGTANADTGEATIKWTGAFTANAYSGMVPWYLEDPKLTVAGNGSGTLTATVGGKGADRTDPEHPFDVPPREVVVATFEDVSIAPDGIEAAPAYAGVDYFPLVDGVRSPTSAITESMKQGEPGWGSWPQSFVDFHYETRLSSYWHTSGLSADPDKAPLPLGVRFASAPPIAELPRVISGPAASGATPYVEGRDVVVTTQIEDADELRWQRAASATGPWTDLSDGDGAGPGSVTGAAGQTLTVHAIDAGWSNRYVRVRAANADGAVATTPLRLTTKPHQALGFSVQPSDALTIAGSQVVLRGRAAGHPAPLDAGYGAELSADGGQSWTALPDVDWSSSGDGAGDEFTVPAVPRSADGALVRLTARNGDGETAVSQPAKLTVAEATGGPQLAVAPAGGVDPAVVTTLTVVGAGFTIPDGPDAQRSYSLDLGLFERSAWQPGAPAHRGWLATSSETSSGQLYKARLDASGGWFSVTLNVPAGKLDAAGVHGLGAFLRLYDVGTGASTFEDRAADAWVPLGLGGQTAATIARQPADVVADAGAVVELTAEAAGTPAPALRWQRQTAGESGWSDLPGETTGALRLTVGPEHDGARFRLVADNGLGLPAVSEPALVTAREELPPEEQPQQPGEPQVPGPGPADPPAAPSEPKPGAAPDPRPEPQPAGARFALTVPKQAARLGAGRTATVATLRCAAGGAACRVSAPRRVRVTIAGRAYAATVLAPKTVAAGRRAALRVRLPEAAARRLRGRSARLRLTVTVTGGGTRSTRTLAVALR